MDAGMVEQVIDAGSGRGVRRYLKIGHRGASAYAPENTLASIRKAAELGADMVELDVHCCRDGTPVIIHDQEISRTTDGRGSVYDYRLQELKQFDAGGGERIPTLDEAIQCCLSLGLGLYLEIKDVFCVGSIAAAVRADNLFDKCIVSSFRADWLADLKAQEPRIRAAVLFGSIYVDPVLLARAAGADYVHPGWETQAVEPHKLLTPEWIARVRAAGLGIIAWHEERPSEIAALQALALDGICSNAPDLLR
jgi:glycerophosphoryl diester phosphodiesterase